MDRQEIKQSTVKPSAGRGSSWRSWWTSGIAAFMLVGFVCYLLGVTYRAQQHLQKTAMIRLQENLEGLARAVDYFILERRNDLQNLATSNTAAAYFSNKALGMSMEYGLKGSLNNIAMQFRHLNESSLVKTGSIYSRLTLFSPDGEILAEYTGTLPSPIQKLDWPAISETSPDASRVSVDRANPTYLLFSAPVIQQERIVGLIAGWVPLDVIHDHFLKIQRSADAPISSLVDSIILVPGKDGQVTGDTWKTIPVSDIRAMLAENNRFSGMQASSDNPWAYEWVDTGKNKKLIAVAARLDDLNIRLFHIMERQQIVDTLGPVNLLIILGLVSAAVIGIFFISLHYGTRAQVLAARLSESDRKQAEIKRTNEHLAREISHRQQAEKRLFSEKNLLRSLIVSIPDLIFYKDLDSLYIGANPAFEQFCGVKETDITGKTPCGLFADETAALFLQQDKAVFKTGRTMQFEQWVDYPDGRQILLDTKKTPYYSNQGDIIGLIGISRDITARKKMELDLEEQRERLELVINGTNIGLWDWNVQTGETIFNERWADIVGYSLAELSPVSIRTWSNLAHLDDLALSGTLLEKHFSGQTDYYDCECRMRHKSGQWVWVHDRGKVVKWTGDGKPLRMLGTHADITDRKRAEEGLCHANETLELRVRERTLELEKLHAQMVIQEKMATVGQLAAGIAHELNNPLNFVSINFVTLAEYFEDIVDMFQVYRKLSAMMENMNPCLPEIDAFRVREAELKLDFILNDTPALFTESRRGFERIARIIQSMRDFSHVDRTGEFTAFNINACIEDTLVIARNEYKYIADVTTDLGELSEIRCLPEQLNQVFLNLIVNSAHAIETLSRTDRGRITIRTWQDETNVFFEIADDGPGIPAEIRTRIFEPFFTTKPPGRGTGLGLSICYDIIVEKHKGILSIHCPESGGSVFSIRIPNNLRI